MGKRRVEITLISAEGLKLSSLTGKPHTYAVVWIHPSKKFYTHVDQDGGKNPAWNHKFVLSTDTFSLEHGSGKFHIEIFHRGQVHDKSVGTVEVPFNEIPHEARFNREEPSAAQFMAFEIRRPSGKNKGILNLSIRLREVSPHSSSSSSSSSSSASEPNSPKKSSPPRHEDHPPAAYPPAPGGYPPSNYLPPPPVGYPPSDYNRDFGYPQQGYGYGGYSGGYGSSAQGYGNYPPQPSYYGANPTPPPPAKSGHSNLALGAGIAAGALGGLVLGEVVEDIAENAAENAAEEAVFDDDY